jgi:dTDP-4-amino-4,6-dideoxygalactose transaminase
VPSARAGLRFLFQALELPPGSEVICSAFAYPIVPFLVKDMGLEPRFVDCELETLGLDPRALEEAITDKTAMVIATHLYGVPCQIREISHICKAHQAHLVEDCAHCYGASVGGRKAGAFGTAAYFSFETSKMVNTMGGGIVTLNDAALADRVKEAALAEPRKDMSWLAKRLAKTTFEATVTHPVLFNLGVYQALRVASGGKEDRFASGYTGDEVSMAGRMGQFTNYQARLARKQMAKIGVQVEKRNENAERLMGRLEGRVHFQRPAGDDVFANFMLVTALFDRMPEVARRLLRRGVDTKHEYMRECSRMFSDGGDFPNAVRAERQVLHLPAYPQLSTSTMDRIAESVEAVLNEMDG